MTAWIAFYCFGKIWKNANIGVVCSALYTLSIHRIFTLTVNSSLREGSALALLPIVLYCLYCILGIDSEQSSGYRYVSPILAAAYTCLAFIHIPTYEITMLVTLLLGIFCILGKSGRSALKELLKTFLLHLVSFAVMAFIFHNYCYAQLNSLRSMATETIQSKGLYPLFLLCQFWNPETAAADEWDMDFSQITGMGFLLTVSLAVFFILWFSGVFVGHPRQGHIKFAKASAVLSLLLMLMSMNSFPWDRLQHLHKIATILIGNLQYPGRFLGWASVLAVTIYGGLLWFYEKNNKKLYWLCIVLAAASLATSSIYLMDYTSVWRYK